MSYEKVKSISIDEKQGKVFINCASNNVRPLSYSREEYPYFSKILQEEGREAVEIALLRCYEEGNLQEGSNKYTRALKVLFYALKNEYSKFNWRNHNAKYGTPEREAEENLRKSEEFKELLKKALAYGSPKTQFVITKDHHGEKVYAKVCQTCVKWKWDKKEATKFNFEEEAQDHIYNQYKDFWKVESLEDKKYCPKCCKEVQLNELLVGIGGCVYCAENEPFIKENLEAPQC